jgi:MFS family permease
MSIGLSIGLSPLVLGVLADRVGVRSAFSVEIVLIVIAAFVLLVILRHERDAVVDSPVSLGHNA